MWPPSRRFLKSEGVWWPRASGWCEAAGSVPDAGREGDPVILLPAERNCSAQRRCRQDCLLDQVAKELTKPGAMKARRPVDESNHLSTVQVSVWTMRRRLSSGIFRPRLANFVVPGYLGSHQPVALAGGKGSGEDAPDERKEDGRKENGGTRALSSFLPFCGEIPGSWIIRAVGSPILADELRARESCGGRSVDVVPLEVEWPRAGRSRLVFLREELVRAASRPKRRPLPRRGATRKGRSLRSPGGRRPAYSQPISRFRMGKAQRAENPTGPPRSAAGQSARGLRAT